MQHRGVGVAVSQWGTGVPCHFPQNTQEHPCGLSFEESFHVSVVKHKFSPACIEEISHSVSLYTVCGCQDQQKSRWTNTQGSEAIQHTADRNIMTFPWWTVDLLSCDRWFTAVHGEGTKLLNKLSLFSPRCSSTFSCCHVLCCLSRYTTFTNTSGLFMMTGGLFYHLSGTESGCINWFWGKMV